MSAGQLYQGHRILYHKCSAAGMTGRTPLETVAHNARLRDNPRAVLDGLSTSAAKLQAARRYTRLAALFAMQQKRP